MRPALFRSAATASATPGYWTLTTTSSSPSRAAWTWPIDAAMAAGLTARVMRLVGRRFSAMLVRRLPGGGDAGPGAGLVSLDRRGRRDAGLVGRRALLGALALGVGVHVVLAGQLAQLEH